VSRLEIGAVRGLCSAALALAAATPLGAAPDAPLDAASAKAFISSLYKPYAQPFNATWDYVAPADATVYEPALARAMDADSALHPNAPGTNWGDIDILCMCQAYDKVTQATVIKSVAGGHAKAVTTVTVMDSGAPNKTVLNFNLVQVGGAWRVYDLGETGYSLREAVMSELKSSQAKRHAH
jgi:hypothetical protein